MEEEVDASIEVAVEKLLLELDEGTKVVPTSVEMCVVGCVGTLCSNVKEPVTILSVGEELVSDAMLGVVEVWGRSARTTAPLVYSIKRMQTTLPTYRTPADVIKWERNKENKN